MLHRTILTAASVVALTAAASAADLGGYQGGQAADLGSYPGPAYASINWSGFYIGVNAGYGFDNSNIGSRLGTAIDPSLDLSPAGGLSAADRSAITCSAPTWCSGWKQTFKAPASATARP
jgi:opacity protein-like surface antigen